MLTANLIRQMVGDRELQEVSGNAFVAENRARVFDGRADVEVFALRIVSGNEIETTRIFVVNAGRIHETAGAGGLERLRQLSNFKSTQICRQCDQMILFQKTDHLGFAAFVGFQKIVLIFGNHFRPFRIRIGE